MKTKNQKQTREPRQCGDCKAGKSGGCDRVASSAVHIMEKSAVHVVQSDQIDSVTDTTAGSIRISMVRGNSGSSEIPDGLPFFYGIPG
jgi:hypothetical protein